MCDLGCFPKTVMLARVHEMCEKGLVMITHHTIVRFKIDWRLRVILANMWHSCL